MTSTHTSDAMDSKGGTFAELIERARHDYEQAGGNIEAIPRVSKDALLIWWVEMLITGGGVDLYLNDAASSLNGGLVELCQRIGAAKTATLFRDLSDLFPSGSFPSPVDKKARTQRRPLGEQR